MKMKTLIILIFIPMILFTFSVGLIDAQTRPAGRYSETSTRYLTPKDLKGKSVEDLKIMRNEIFARHGYKFKTTMMKEYFKYKKWYQPRYDNVTAKLTEIERANVKMLKQYENKLLQDIKTSKILDIIKKQKRELVFHVPWGPGPTELGNDIPEEASAEGPMSFAVDDSGTIFVLDQINQRVQAYDRSGNHIKSIPIPSRTFEDIAIGQSGQLILLDEYRYKAVVFMDDHGRVLKKVDLVGKGIPKLTGVSYIHSRPDGVWVNYSDYLVKICDAQGEPEKPRLMLSGYVFSKDGQYNLTYRKLGDITCVVKRNPVGRSSIERFTHYFEMPMFLAILDTDQKGNIFLGLHMFDESLYRGPPYDIEYSHLIVMVLDKKTGKEKQRIYMPVSSLEEEVNRPLRVTPGGIIYQLLVRETGAAMWRYHP